MKFSTAPLTATVAVSALLALPCAAAAQTAPATQPPATAQPAAQPPADAAQAPAQGSPQDHLRQAKASLDDVGTANLSARARTQVAELKKRLTTLERMAAAGNTGAVTATKDPPTTRVARTSANWGTEVAAMDKIVTSLLGISPTGTAGTTGTKAATTVSLDDVTRAKLTEFRTHLTAFATAMSGQPPAGETPPAAAAPATEPAKPTPPATEPPPTTPPATQPTQTTPPAQEPAAAAPQKVDAEAAKRHLTEARNTLSQLTQLPAAAKLSGDARTQVTQLITNFNELITTQSNWTAAYAKVSANMMALLGPDTGSPSTSSTPGAVGTSGSGVTLDPGLREKLVEMRKHLVEFERASGGAPAPASAPPPDPAAAATPKPAAEPAAPPAAAPAPATETAQSPAAGDALTHVAAIEALLKLQNESGGMTLDKAQVELLRTHIAELRKLLEKK